MRLTWREWLFIAAALAAIPSIGRPQSQIDLTRQVRGVLPLANGGTANTTGQPGFPLLAPDGTAGAPSYSWASRPTFGWYLDSAGIGTWSQNGLATFGVGTSLAILASADRGVNWYSAVGTGTYTSQGGLVFDASNTLGFRNGTNAQALRVYNTFTDAGNYERADLVWSANQFYLQTNQAGTGGTEVLNVRTVGASNLNFGTNALNRWTIGGSTGHLLTQLDNTYDIGASGANRPRDFYLARNLFAAGRAFITSVTDTDNTALLQLGTGDGSITTRSAITTRNGGYTAPTDANTQANGDKLVFWNAAALKLAIGVDDHTMWFQAHGADGGAATSFQWHGGLAASSAELMRLTGPVNQRELLLNTTTRLNAAGYSGVRANGSTGGFFDVLSAGTRVGTMYSDPAFMNVGTIAGLPLHLMTGGGTGVQVKVGYVPGAVANWVVLHGRASGNNPVVGANGTDTNVALYFVSKGTGSHSFYTGGSWDSGQQVSAANEQFRVIDTASSTRIVTVTGSNGGNPTISTSAGSLGFGVSLQPTADNTLDLGLPTARVRGISAGTGKANVNAAMAATFMYHLGGL